MTAPFFEARHRTPIKVKIPLDAKKQPQPVVKLVCGFRHSLAITKNGKIYGWGYNNQQQLSHSTEYADQNSPMHAIFAPTRLLGPLADLFVVDAAAGEEMSIIVAQGKKAGLIFEQVYACGNNLKGSLGINRPSHLQDLTLVPDLSDLFDETEQALMIEHIQCGRRHCVAKFDYGGFKFWGDNQVGQLGNRKRSYLESPYPSKKFELRHNVENVVLAIDSSAVIVEDTGRVKKKKNKNKRIIKEGEVIKTQEELELRTKALIQKEEETEKDKRGRNVDRETFFMKMRRRVSETIYGKSAGRSGPSALDIMIEKEREQRKKEEEEKAAKEAASAQQQGPDGKK